MFDKGLNNIEELEKFGEVKRTVVEASCFDDFTGSSVFSPSTLDWLSRVDRIETSSEVPSSS